LYDLFQKQNKWFNINSFQLLKCQFVINKATFSQHSTDNNTWSTIKAASICQCTTSIYNVTKPR